MECPQVEIYLELYGHLVKKTGIKDVKLFVPSSLREASNVIYSTIKNDLGINSPAVLVLNGLSLYTILETAQKTTLNGGERIKVIPLFGGG